MSSWQCIWWKYLIKILRRLVSIFWKCIHMYNCIFWHKIAGNLGIFSKRTAGCWVDYDMGSRPRRAELLWCRKGDIFCKISWIWIAKFPRCVWSWRCNKLFWFKGTQKSWMHATAVWDDCLREMRSLPLAAFNTLCILGSSLNYLKNKFLSITNKLENPEHKLSSLLRYQSWHHSFFGASRSSRNSRKRLEIKRNQAFNPF